MNRLRQIFREVVGNLIVHREYTNAYPATLIIYPDRVETANANNPHGEGPIHPDHFAPFPKNPALAKFFIQLGRVDELGSGVLNVNRLLEQYTPGEKPVFVEGAVFTSSIPVSFEGDAEPVNGPNEPVKASNDTVNTLNEPVNTLRNALKQASLKLGNNIINNLATILNVITQGEKGASVNDIVKVTGKSRATAKRYLQILKQVNLIEFKGAPKTGSYYIKLQPD